MLSTKTANAIGGMLLIAITGCQGAKTSTDAPNSTNPDRIETPSNDSSKTAQNDATSDIRRKQLESDIRAREQRNNAFNSGQATDRSNNDLASEVRSKLEANLPASALTVSAKDGAVTVTGTVSTQEQFAKIANLAKEIKGVTDVTTKVVVKK